MNGIKKILKLIIENPYKLYDEKPCLDIIKNKNCFLIEAVHAKYIRLDDGTKFPLSKRILTPLRSTIDFKYFLDDKNYIIRGKT